MAFEGLTFNPPPLTDEALFPPGKRVERTLQVWAMSRSRSSMALARNFLNTCFSHLEAGGPPMYRLERLHEHGVKTTLLVHLTNSHDADYLLGRVYWCGCEFIAFTLYNVYTNTTTMFPHAGKMHGLPYMEEAEAPVEVAVEGPAPAVEESEGEAEE
ncbi:hypothetical protein BRADI_2g11855v3 [Brachypodium distachyon]|uniref:Uncharacterized protein n=1 Tax=Brachypodium distachyon TaxID=15368 RepID=A0A2K2D836_BRADI|nr:hypothetical protein BRADI_2g11855v3 [Brachypodium distachyon]